MSCIFPSTIRVNKKYGCEYIEVPCRKCINCRIQRESDIEFSCLMAMQQAYCNSRGCSFVTITYTNDTVPLSVDKTRYTSLVPSVNMTLRKKHFQDFMKRLRQNAKRRYGLEFQHLSCGEYGDSFQRPHMHILLFGLEQNLAKDLVRDSWHYGLIDVGALGSGGIRYVADYVMKQSKDEDMFKFYDKINIERPFLVHSVKLGHEYFFNKFPYTQDFRYKKNGRNAIIPATYRKHIDELRSFEFFDANGHIEASKAELPYSIWQMANAVARAENQVIEFRQQGRPCYAIPPHIVDYVSDAVSKDFSYVPVKVPRSEYSSYQLDLHYYKLGIPVGYFGFLKRYDPVFGTPLRYPLPTVSEAKKMRWLL